MVQAKAKSRTELVCVAGQSLCTAPAGGATTFAYKVFNALGTKYYIRAHGGTAINVPATGDSFDLMQMAHEEVDHLAKQAHVTTLIMCMGTTDIHNGDSAATVYADHVAYAEARRVAGFTNIICLTIPPNTVNTTGPGGMEEIRQAANVLLLANADGAFDTVVDLSVSFELEDETDIDYYYDGIHWTDASTTIVAQILLGEYEALVPTYSELFDDYDDAIMAAGPEAYWPIWSDGSGSVVNALTGNNGAYVNNPLHQQTVDGVPLVVTVDGISQYLTCPFSTSNIAREIVLAIRLYDLTPGEHPIVRDASDEPALFDEGGTFMAGVCDPGSNNPGGWHGRARSRELDNNNFEADIDWHLHSLFVRTTVGNSEYRIDNELGQVNGSANLSAWFSPFYIGRNGEFDPPTFLFTQGAIFGFAIFPQKLTVPQRDTIYAAFAAILAGP